MFKDIRSALKRIGACLGTIVLVGSLVSAYAYADEGKAEAFLPALRHATGHKPVDKKPNRVPGDADVLFAQSEEPLPERYRSDEQDWASGIKVKDQNPAGLCWTFAVTTAAEYSYAKETYEQFGAVSEVSPGHLGYFLYNRVNDPLGNTEGDGTYGYSSEGWPNEGGDAVVAMQHLATYSGMCLEQNTGYDKILERFDYDESSGSYTWDGSTPPYEDSAAYDDYITLQECICAIPDGESLEENVEEIKRLISTYGAVDVPVQYDFEWYAEEEVEENKDFAYGHNFYNYTGSFVPNHDVVIIGWDDSYAASNFSHKHDFLGNPLTIVNEKGETVELTEEEALEITTPPGDGAWIVQNSWGEAVHDNGFFHMSYYSADVCDKPELFIFDMQPADTYEYNFQYDGNTYYGDTTDRGNDDFRTNSGTSASNVYTNTTGGPITLDGVGFTVWSYGEIGYEISVYTDLRDEDDPTSGLLAGTTSVTTTTAGVKTATLDDPVTIGAGERFAIVFDFLTDDTAFGIEKSVDIHGYYNWVAQLDPGQSFYFDADSDEWKDMYQYDACFRIKGLANPLDAESASYEVVFEDGWGNVLDTQRVAHGQAAEAQDPVRRGYSFAGWDADLSEVTTNLLVRATWEHAPEWDRLAGADRYATMASIVEAGFEASDWVVVATGANFPDALMAASLAGSKGCPVVLTKGTDSKLGQSARDTIVGLRASNAYVVGGTGVISEGIEAELESMGVAVTRIAGSDRQSTSAATLKELADGEPDTVVVATGWGFADALSIGPWCYTHGAPILLAKDGELSPEQVKAIRAIKSIKNVVIVGGTAAVSDDVRIQLGRSYAYERLAGSDRYATSAAVAEWEMDEWGMGLANVAVSTGGNYPDALAGAALCGRNDSVLLLVTPGKKGTKRAFGLIDTDPHAVEVGYVLGGTGAVPDSIMEQLRGLTQ